MAARRTSIPRQPWLPLLPRVKLSFQGPARYKNVVGEPQAHIQTGFSSGSRRCVGLISLSFEQGC